jgi:hypothetical protein
VQGNREEASGRAALMSSCAASALEPCAARWTAPSDIGRRWGHRVQRKAQKTVTNTVPLRSTLWATPPCIARSECAGALRSTLKGSGGRWSALAA